MEATVQKLTTLDFSPGIRAKDINNNFQLLKKWIDEERLRIGGWGLVEGFNLTKDVPNFSVNVSEGTIINEHGEEIKTENTKLFAGTPSWRNITEEVVADENGIIELQFAPYSNINKKTLYYNPPTESSYNETEITIVNVENEKYLTLKDIRNITENKIVVNSEFKGVKFRISYLYANDRIDGILLKKDGTEYIYELGIISTSPSQQIIQDYMDAGYYLIGFAYWHIGKEIDVEFITKDRSLRPIYVNNQGQIFLNGVAYTGYNFIFFEEPKNPEENDLWYNVEEEILYIWRPNSKGKYEWKPVNDLSRFNREYGYFSLDEAPKDLQTFTFEDKANLRFVPNKNQLTIVIDQVVVMKDQYDELYTQATYDENVCTGYGFRLKEPLERPCIVEVFVDHNVNTKAQNLELFPHIAAFIESDSINITANTAAGKIITTTAEYELGNCQLEVWLNGKRLEINRDYSELTKKSVVASIGNLGELSKLFKLNISLKADDIIFWKITRAMATYDNFRKVTDNLNQKVNDAVESLNETEENLNTVIRETGTSIEDLKSKVTTNENNIKMLSESKISKVTITTLDANLKGRIIKDKTAFTTAITSNEILIPNLSIDDFITICFVDGLQRLPLIKDEDYFINDNNGKGIIIELDTKWIGSQTAKLYIEAILIGVD